METSTVANSDVLFEVLYRQLSKPSRDTEATANIERDALFMHLRERASIIGMREIKSSPDEIVLENLSDHTMLLVGLDLFTTAICSAGSISVRCRHLYKFATENKCCDVDHEIYYGTTQEWAERILRDYQEFQNELDKEATLLGK